MLQPSAPDADEPLAACGLFKDLTASQRARVASLIVERDVEAGTLLMQEGEAATDLLIIQAGSVEVTKRVAAGDRDQCIATLGPSMTLGEMTLLDRAPRSASARAAVATRVGILSMDDLARLARAETAIEQQLLRNLANELSRRLRFTNETTVAALEQQLALERQRAIMGRFVVLMAFMMVTYAFLLYVAIKLLPGSVAPSAITIPITALWGGMLLDVIRRSGLPLVSFGLTLHNWRVTLREALAWSALACGAATVVKLGLILGNTSFADERLFNLSGLLDARTSWLDLRASLVLALMYALVAPLQEFIVRSGLQAALQRCLVGRAVNARAIVVSNALFASAHLHLSLSFAIFAFFPGLLWGALFARQQRLIGVAVSHLLCGWFAFLVLGFEPWY